MYTDGGIPMKALLTNRFKLFIVAPRRRVRTSPRRPIVNPSARAMRLHNGDPRAYARRVYTAAFSLNRQRKQTNVPFIPSARFIFLVERRRLSKRQRPLRRSSLFALTTRAHHLRARICRWDSGAGENERKRRENTNTPDAAAEIITSRPRDYRSCTVAFVTYIHINIQGVSKCFIRF